MALFRKPKKNIRRRNVDTDEEGTENVGEPMDVDIVGNGVKKVKEKLKESDGPKPATLLSFADDEGEFSLLL